jgi:hypothetical protein
MYRKLAITIVALSLGGCIVLTSPPASAQPDQQRKNAPAGQPRGAGGGARTVTPSAPRAVAPRAVAPRMATPRTVTPRTVTSRTVTPRTVTPRVATPRTVTRRTVSPRTVTPRVATPRTVTPRAVTPRIVTPRTPRTVTPRVVTPRTTPTVAPSTGGNVPVVTAGRLRGMPSHGVGRTTLRGENFSVWRSGYRVREGSRWRTFVALRALSALMIGSSRYYPYAYISAPQQYCEGLTEDGCELRWQEVETIEGDLVDQCVAYCPWR